MVQLVHRKDIDTERWNDIISQSAGETLYAYAWYLDSAADNWSALIMEDYRFIMPLIWRKKFGIKYAYHPNFLEMDISGGLLFDQRKFTREGPTIGTETNSEYQIGWNLGTRFHF